MSVLRAMVTIPRESGFPSDAVTNTWHFNTDGSDNDASAALILDRLDDFYNVDLGIQPVAKYFSREIVGASTRLKVYNLDDDEPRSPILDAAMPLTEGTAGDALPSEIAVCLSYHLAPVSGLPQARRRGRIYLGPLSSQTQAFVSGECFVDGGFIADICLAASALANADTADTKWCVYSPTNDSGIAPVVGGWVDNAFDVQRRRGVDPTVRNTWVRA